MQSISPYRNDYESMSCLVEQQVEEIKRLKEENERLNRGYSNSFSETVSVIRHVEYSLGEKMRQMSDEIKDLKKSKKVDTIYFVIGVSLVFVLLVLGGLLGSRI